MTIDADEPINMITNWDRWAQADRDLAFDLAPLKSLQASIAETSRRKLVAVYQLESLAADLRGRNDRQVATCSELAQVVDLLVLALQCPAQSKN